MAWQGGRQPALVVGRRPRFVLVDEHAAKVNHGGRIFRVDLEAALVSTFRIFLAPDSLQRNFVTGFSFAKSRLLLLGRKWQAVDVRSPVQVQDQQPFQAARWNSQNRRDYGVRHQVLDIPLLSREQPEQFVVIVKTRRKKLLDKTKRL